MPAPKIGGGPSGTRGEFTAQAAKKSAFGVFTKGEPLARVLLRKPRDAESADFFPPDFGGGHQTAPRLHQRIFFDSPLGGRLQKAFLNPAAIPPGKSDSDEFPGLLQFFHLPPFFENQDHFALKIGFGP